MKDRASPLWPSSRTLHCRKRKQHGTAPVSYTHLLIAEKNTAPVSFGNARGVRNLFEQILTAQCNRLAAQETLSREDLMKLTRADVETIRALPEKKLV